ncbi:hypothetical protein [Nonlabens sp.]|uniref:hypothetical protein n=1 Tax=Nonlabens sp. TaxID=1888209 RepID=UPI001BCB2664|nr:hypothetical protein [Nonlabens sp.]
MFEDDDDYDLRSHEKLPVFIKAIELYNLVDSLLKGSNKEDRVETQETKEHEEYMEHFFESSKDMMMANAMLIPAKIAGAEGGDIYDLRMENAAIIRKAAREIITDARGLQMSGFPDIEYLDLLRNEVDQFRVLFAKWVKTFDQENYIIDRWGLFNPPGVNYDDHDPDDDIPFNADDFLGDL